MERRTLGRTGLDVSLLGFGCGAVGVQALQQGCENLEVLESLEVLVTDRCSWFACHNRSAAPTANLTASRGWRSEITSCARAKRE